MSRAAAPVVPVSGIDVDAKLALVEFLLTSLDLQESARRAVDWLVAHAPVDQAVVMVADGASPQILLVADYGVSSATVMDFSLTREETSNPLVQALERDEHLAAHPAGLVPGGAEPLPHGLVPLRLAPRA